MEYPHLMVSAKVSLTLPTVGLGLPLLHVDAPVLTLHQQAVSQERGVVVTVAFGLCDHVGPVRPVLRTAVVEDIAHAGGYRRLVVTPVGALQDRSHHECVDLVWDPNQKVVSEGQICLYVWIVGWEVPGEVRGTPAFLESWGECVHDPIDISLPGWYCGIDRISVWRGPEATKWRQHQLAGTIKKPSQPTRGGLTDPILGSRANRHE